MPAACGWPGPEVRHTLATIGLGPLLLLQARHVRRVTPRLPEASGERQGELGNGPLLRLLIAGDSAAAGVGAELQTQALSGQLAQLLAADFRVSWTLVATTGHTTAQALQQLRELPEARYDVVVTSLGVNDVTGRTPTPLWLRQQAELVELMRQRFQARLVLLSGLPPMHVFPALPQPLRWYLGAQAQRYNMGLQAWSQGRDGLEFLPLDFPPDTALMASDGFHPGPGAYSVWAQQLAGRIRERWAA